MGQTDILDLLEQNLRQEEEAAQIAEQSAQELLKKAQQGVEQVEEGLVDKAKDKLHGVALQRAVKKRLIPYNVARDAEPPPRGPKKERTTLSLEQVANFFKAAAEAESRFEAQRRRHKCRYGN